MEALIGDRAIVSRGKSCRDTQICEQHGTLHVATMTDVPDTLIASKFLSKQISFESSLGVALKESQAEISFELSLTEAMSYWPPSENRTTLSHCILIDVQLSTVCHFECEFHWSGWVIKFMHTTACSEN